MRKAFFIALLLLWPGPARAQGIPPLIFPVACTLGQDCWTVNYVDIDPAENAARDFACGHKTYDDHRGTDFALRSMAEVEAGVDVLAAASGKILKLRDGETDTPKTAESLDAIRAERKECGNAVLIDHGGGLQTLYCHLRQGSISVKIGQTIGAGQKIAQVGHSGLAEFPHLHFGVVSNGKIIDPYRGMQESEECGTAPADSLWAPGLPMAYEPVALYDAGLSPGEPDFTAIQNGGAAPPLNAASPALVFWTAIYGAAKDDAIELEIMGPDGKTFTKRSIIQDKDRARQYYYTGRKAQNGLARGSYTARAILRRAGIEDREITRSITID